jgi:hypothetical protein
MPASYYGYEESLKKRNCLNDEKTGVPGFII